MDKTIDSLMKSTRFDYINDDSKRKIAHAAEQVMIALNGMSKLFRRNCDISVMTLTPFSVSGSSSHIR